MTIKLKKILILIGGILIILLIWKSYNLKECDLDEKVFLERVEKLEHEPMLLNKIKKLELMCSRDDLNLIISKINGEPEKDKIYALFILAYLESRPERIDALYAKTPLSIRRNIIIEIQKIKKIDNNSEKFPEYYWKRIETIEEYFRN